MAEHFHSAGIAQSDGDSVHGVVAVVVARLRATVAEDRVQLPLVSQVSGDGAFACLNPSFAAFFVEAAIEESQVVGGLARGVAGVVELAGGEFFEVLDGFLLEAAEFLGTGVAFEFPDARKNVLPLFGIGRVSLEGGAVAFVVAVLLDVAEGLVHERIIQASAERDDMLDVKLRMGANKGVHADTLAGVGTMLATLLEEKHFFNVGSGGILNAGFFGDPGGGLFTGGLIPPHLFPRFSALFLGTSHIAGEFDTDGGGLAVLADDCVDHFSEFREDAKDHGVTDMRVLGGRRRQEVHRVGVPGTVKFLHGRGVRHAVLEHGHDFGQGLAREGAVAVF